MKIIYTNILVTKWKTGIRSRTKLIAARRVAKKVEMGGLHKTQHRPTVQTEDRTESVNRQKAVWANYIVKVTGKIWMQINQDRKGWRANLVYT